MHTQDPPARYHEAVAGTVVTFEMVRVTAGPVTLPDAKGGRTTSVAEFYVGASEVTWDLYDVYALGLDRPAGATGGGRDAIARPSEPYGAPDRGWGHAGFPAMSLTREAAERFCEWLAAKTGKAYRLPTEAEWARAAALASAGPPLAGRIDDLAWHALNAGGRTHPVATRKPDALGLFDLFGNVAEWIATPGDSRVVAGGSYRNRPQDVGPEARAPQDPAWNETDPQLPKSRWWLSDGPFVGFRLAVSLNAGVRHE